MATDTQTDWPALLHRACELDRLYLAADAASRTMTATEDVELRELLRQEVDRRWDAYYRLRDDPEYLAGLRLEQAMRDRGAGI